MITGKLPIGIQSFVNIRSDSFLYIDKTMYIARMVSVGKPYFLSRPRRFGKSLFLDTLACAFEGRRELFKGLHLDSPESGWDWERTNPVLRIDFTTGDFSTVDGVLRSIQRRLDGLAAQYHVELPPGSPGEQLADLARLLATSSERQAVVLVDEYDKPILDNLSDPPTAVAIRQVLRELYSGLKAADPWLRFVFLTGVSKFSKAGVFSGLNQLNDITLNPAYGAICGYTQADLDRVFMPMLDMFAPETVREWYNGYNWGPDSVYNPFDVLLLCENRELRPWWFETGTPLFIIKMLTGQALSLPDLDGLELGSELSDSFEPETMSLPVMLFQTGYLTIKERRQDTVTGTRYRLGFPNHEVRSAFSRLTLETTTGNPTGVMTNRSRLWNALEAGGGQLRELFQAFFASIPNDTYRNTQLARYEGFYATVVYAYFASLGLTVIPEDVSNHGRSDLTVIGPTGIWIFEFKVRGLDREPHASPLAQIRARGYADKYRFRSDTAGKPLPIHLIGILFDEVERNIVEWEEG